MRSQAELLEASGYAGRPQDFDDLLRILDGELRLITPTDPEGGRRRTTLARTRPAEGGRPASLAACRPLTRGRYYQLTHDYLVPSLRDWLTRKQRETRRGRAELRLADRAAAVERQAGEPPPARLVGMAQHPPVHPKERLDAAAAEK